MGLTDLMTEIKQDPNNFNGDESIETRVLQHVLQLVAPAVWEVGALEHRVGLKVRFSHQGGTGRRTEH